MTDAASLFLASMTKSREEGDITLKCEGRDIKAHSLILQQRSDYFKTAEAFNTATQNKTKVFEVKECPHHVLEVVINFMYGINLRGPYSIEDAESLLTMADLYLMEDLKDAIASHVAPHLDKDNILEIYHLAEKYNAPTLKEMCSDFIFNSISIAKHGLGVDAATMYIKRKEGRMEKGMIVRCNITSLWFTKDGLSQSPRPEPSDDFYDWIPMKCKAGAIGRIVDVWSSKEMTIRWSSLDSQSTSLGSWERTEALPKGDISHLEILTPSIHTELFKD